MIVVCGGIKGGTGKTTIATNLAAFNSYEGKKVLLVDADEQKSASCWIRVREEQEITTPWVTIQLSGSSLRNQILKMSNDYDNIFIDVGGRDTISLRAALTTADIFITPFQPRSYDIWTLGELKTLINETSVINDKMKSYALINRGDPIGNDNEEAMTIMKDCPELTCIPFIISQRKSFANAASNGLAVFESKPMDKKAILEIERLHAYIFSI